MYNNQNNFNNYQNLGKLVANLPNYNANNNNFSSYNALNQLVHVSSAYTLARLLQSTNTSFVTNPLITRHKVFISYQHKFDWFYQWQLSELLDEISINKSVCDGDIDPENSDEYIKRLINENHINDATVLIVLIGQDTYNRKFIDWEISGALDYKVGNKRAGLIGIVLPTHPWYSTGFIPYNLMPSRLWHNFSAGYAQIYCWNPWIYNKNYLKAIIHNAYSSRQNYSLIENSLPQFKRNR